MQTVKGGLIILGLFLLVTILMVLDPLNLNPNGLNGENLLPIVYVIPSIIGFIIIYRLYNKK